MRTTALVLLLSIVAVGAALLPGARPATATGVTVISTGGHHTCALTTEGGVKCWGIGLSGQLGDGTALLRSPPVDVLTAPGGEPLSEVMSLAAGDSHTCAVTGDGIAKCWGNNNSGQLGDGTQIGRLTPVDVCQVYDDAAGVCLEVLSGIVGISASHAHTCALTSAGGVKCWGQNEDGQLGDGTVGDGNPDTRFDNIRTVPVVVCESYDEVAGQCDAPLSGVAGIDVGGSHSCAVTVAGAAKCWGNNVAGQIGDGTGSVGIPELIIRPTPVDVCQTYDEDAEQCTATFADVAAIAAGGLHTCALMVTGGVMCWGFSGFGRLGEGFTCSDETPFICTTPVAVCADEPCAAPLSGAIALTVGDRHACAATTSGALSCWGRNDRGQLGDGTTTDRTTPVAVVGIESPVVAVAGEDTAHTCALLADGAAKCWGMNFYTQLDIGRCCLDEPSPLDVTGIEAKVQPGDVDCSGEVNSIDALFVLQFHAALMPALPCPEAADVNGDGSVDSIDALLILQFQDCLICPLPVPG